MSTLAQVHVAGTTAPPPTSLRRRLDVTIAALLAATVVILTIASGIMARLELVRAQEAQAAALLEHLLGMKPQSEPALRMEISKLAAHLDSSGATLSVRAANSRSANAGLTVERAIDGMPGRVLQYEISNAQVSRLTRSLVAMHLVAGVLALIAIIGAVEWTLRRRLLAPLRRFRIMLDEMATQGWTSTLPEVDAELAALRYALGNVGPALTARTLEWFRHEQRRESAAAVTRLRTIIEERVPAVLARIEDITRGGRPSVLSLNEAYAAEEEMLTICAALTELQAVIDSPPAAREGHA
jgi:HAMP domain-containing protein